MAKGWEARYLHKVDVDPTGLMTGYLGCTLKSGGCAPIQSVRLLYADSWLFAIHLVRHFIRRLPLLPSFIELPFTLPHVDQLHVDILGLIHHHYLVLCYCSSDYLIFHMLQQIVSITHPIYICCCVPCIRSHIGAVLKISPMNN